MGLVSDPGAPTGNSPGPGVDARGVPVIDPTKNVLDLVEASIGRLDDLREASRSAAASEIAHVKEMAELRAHYDEKLRHAETARIDAIRAVDVGNVQRAAEVAATQAEVLRAQVATVATAAATSLAVALAPLQEAIGDLRKTQYEQAGSRAQVGETRLNYGAILGGISLLLVIVFGVIGVLISLR